MRFIISLVWLFCCYFYTSVLIASTYTFSLHDQQVIDKFFAGDSTPVNKVIPADITFLAIDFKFDGTKLKVLEFQDGPTAGLRAYDEVVPHKGEIWSKFWHDVSQYNLPMWYVGPQPKHVKEGSFSHNDHQRVCFREFLDMHGNYAAHLKFLPMQETFKKVLSSSKVKTKQSRNKSITDYKGIVLAKLDGQNGEISNFTKNYSDFLVINRWSRRVLRNKANVHDLFSQLNLDEYRPWGRIFKKRYSKKIARFALRKSEADYFIVKPINSSRSNGIIMTHRHNLDTVLRKILVPLAMDNEDEELRSYRPKQPLTFGYWKGDNNSKFIIEEYAPSKTITIAGKNYDPTVRVVFVVKHDASQVTFNFLRGFWKVPRKGLEEEATLTDKHISKHRSDLATFLPSDIQINETDMVCIEANLINILLPLYVSILQFQ